MTLSGVPRPRPERVHLGKRGSTWDGRVNIDDVAIRDRKGWRHEALKRLSAFGSCNHGGVAGRFIADYDLRSRFDSVSVPQGFKVIGVVLNVGATPPPPCQRR